MGMNTPIEKAKNIGPITAGKLTSVGIKTLEKLKELGWQDTMILVTEHYPELMVL